MTWLALLVMAGVLLGAFVSASRRPRGGAMVVNLEPSPGYEPPQMDMGPLATLSETIAALSYAPRLPIAPFELDPRYEWVEVGSLCDEHPTYIRGACRHLEVTPVEADGVEVARLCLTCDEQLPATREAT